MCTYCRHHEAMPHKEFCFGCFKKKAILDHVHRQRKQQQWLDWLLLVLLWPKSADERQAVLAEVQGG
jgi:hypothetical protein